MRISPRSAAAFVALTLVACSTEPGGRQNTTLKGILLDYDQGTAVAGADITLADAPDRQTTTDSTGHFSLTQLQRDASVRVVASGSNYRESINPVTHLGAATLNVTAYAAGSSYIDGEYQSAGVTEDALTATVVAELEDELGTPRDGIPLPDIALLDAAQSAVGAGPFVFGSSGDLDNTLTQTETFNDKSRIAFLNVPAGSYTLKIVLADTTLVRPLSTSASGFTLVRL